MSWTPTRRDALEVLLGWPLLAAGCGSRSIESALGGSLPFAGEIVGPSHTLGHKLRDAAFVSAPIPPATGPVKSIAIVGGGVAGLAAAWELQRKGIEDFVVIELEPQPGGNSRAGSSAVTAFPWGAHYLPAPPAINAPLVDLLEEMGLVTGRDAAGDPEYAEQHLVREPEERVWAGGRWHAGLYLEHGATADDHAQLKRFQQRIDELAFFDPEKNRNAFALPLAGSSDAPLLRALDQITMEAWLDREGFTSSRLRWLVDYACRDDYGLRAGATSAWAGVFYFASRLRKPGDSDNPLLAWPEGNGRLVKHLADKVGRRLTTGVAVRRIQQRVTPGGSIVELALMNARGEPLPSLAAKRIIFAAPTFLAPRLIADYPAQRDVSRFTYSPWLVANVHLKDRPRAVGASMAWDNVLYDSRSLGYVAATHQRGVDHGPTVLTWYLPLCDPEPAQARGDLLAMTWEDCARAAVLDLSGPHPDILPLIDRVDVMRWGHAMIRPTPGFIWSDARTAAAQPLGAIHFAHSDLSGLSLFEEAFAHGLRAAQEITDALRLK